MPEPRPSLASGPPSGAQCLTLGVSASLLLFLAALALWNLMPFYRDYVSGDLPHYLLAVQSLVEDGDFDLANNYAAPERYAAFYPHVLDYPQYAPGTTRPFRSIGIPLLLTPGWLIGGPLGAMATAAVFLCAAAGLLGAVALADTRSIAASLAVAGLTIFNYPVVTYLFYPYPDVFSGVIHLLFFLILTRRLENARRPAVWAIGTGLMMASLMWLHFKFALLSPLYLALFALWAPARGRVRLAALFALPLLAGAAGYVLYDLSTGVELFGYADQGGVTQWPQAVFGLLFDKQFGIFYLFPLLMLPIAEITRQLLIGPRRAAATAVALIVSLYILHAWFSGWWGGFTPTGRHTLSFLFILLYFLIPFTVRCQQQRPRFLYHLVCGLLVLAFAIHTVVMIGANHLNETFNIHPLSYGKPSYGLYLMWDIAQMLHHYGLNEYLPSLVFITGKGLRTLFITLTVIMLFALWHSWPDLRERGRPRVRNLVLFFILWSLVCGLLYWDLHAYHRTTRERVFRQMWGHSPRYFRDHPVP